MKKSAIQSLLANSLTLAVSFLTVTLLPLLASIETYGYWNLYLLAVSFVYVLSFGVNDGVYLRYGGASRDGLNWPVLAKVFLILTGATLSFALTFAIIASSFFALPDAVVSGIAASIPLMILRSFLTYLLQATNQIARYAVCIALDRGVFVALLLGLLFNSPSLWVLIAADVAAKGVSLLYALTLFRPVLMSVSGVPTTRSVLPELSSCMSAGMVLMAAGAASMATTGVVRIIIERQWGIVSFAGVALALSAAHLVTSCIQAIALVLFPWLRTVSISEMRRLHRKIDTLVVLMGFLLIFSFFPIRELIEKSLPQYQGGAEFLYLIFPVVIYEVRLALLVAPFCNALRKERVLLAINSAGLAVSALMAGIAAFLLHDLGITVLTMLVAQAVRAIAGEVYIRTAVELPWLQPVLTQFAVVVAFIIAALLPGMLYGVLIMMSVALTLLLSHCFTGLGSIRVRGRKIV